MLQSPAAPSPRTTDPDLEVEAWMPSIGVWSAGSTYASAGVINIIVVGKGIVALYQEHNYCLSQVYYLKRIARIETRRLGG